MRIFAQLTVYVVAFSIGYAVTEAGDDGLDVTRITPAPGATRESSLTPAAHALPAPEHCDACREAFIPEWRAVPDIGSPGSPTWGYRHYPLPMHNYTNWYRPRAATLTRTERCEQDPFRPRGLGHLFARPRDGFRMEYSPYVLCDAHSAYGPVYIARQPDPQCDDCNHSADCLCHH